MTNKEKRKNELELFDKLIDNLEMTEKERFKQIIINGTKTDYYCSNFGYIISTKKKKNTKLRPIRMPNGYYVITLYINKKAYREYIHRIVGMTFIEIPEKYKKANMTFKDLQINHKKGDEKWNNTVFNLEWVTDSENKIHEYKTGLNKKGEDSHLSKYTDNQITDVCELLIQNSYTPKEISKVTGVSVSAIQDIKHHGCRHDITDKYDFSGITDKKLKYDKKDIKKALNLLKENKMTTKDISIETGLPVKIIYYYKYKK